METIKLDLIPGKKMPSLHASQYDDGREHGIDLFENGVVYKLDGTETLTINERKGDDCICSLDIENTFTDSNHIVFASTEQMCAVWGNNICELVIAKGEKTIGTLNFILEIEPSPTENGIESESEIKNLKRQIEAITEEVIGEDYYTKTQTDDAIATAIEGKADTTYVNEELAKKADKTDTYTKSQTDNLLNDKANVTDLPDMTQYYDKSEVDDLLDDKANSDDVYGKAYIDTALSGKANVGTSYTKSEEDDLLANKADKIDTYTKEQVDDIVYNILPDDTASGSVANFTTSLELPIKSLEVDVNAVQEEGTPTPATPLPISGWSEISLAKCGDNLVDVKPFSDWIAVRSSYYVLRSCVPNAVINVSLIDKDVSVDLSGISFGFVDSKWDGTEQITTREYRWVVQSGAPQTNKKNTAIGDASIILTGLIFYPQTEETYNKIMARYNLEFEIDVAASFKPYNGNTEVINLGGTYYGGHFTQNKDGHRQFEVTGKSVKIQDLVWTYYSAYSYFHTTVLDIKVNESASSVLEGLMCERYANRTASQAGSQNVNYSIAGLNRIIRIKDLDYTDVNTFVNANGDCRIVYPLATPIIIDLPDGEPIITLNGTNNIYADTGDCAVEYKCSVAEYVANHSGGGGAKSLGGVFLGGSNSGSEEEPTKESEETEKTKEIDEPKEEIKTIGDVKKLGGE